jgi:hypothetical protein
MASMRSAQRRRPMSRFSPALRSLIQGRVCASAGDEDAMPRSTIGVRLLTGITLSAGRAGTRDVFAPAGD